MVPGDRGVDERQAAAVVDAAPASPDVCGRPSGSIVREGAALEGDVARGETADPATVDLPSGDGRGSFSIDDPQTVEGHVGGSTDDVEHALRMVATDFGKIDAITLFAATSIFADTCQRIKIFSRS